MGTVLLGKLQKRLRFEGIFGFNAKFLPTIHKKITLGRELLEKFDTSRVEVGSHGILGVENLQLRNYIYTEHLRLGACDCARAIILRKETICPTRNGAAAKEFFNIGASTTRENIVEQVLMLRKYACQLQQSDYRMVIANMARELPIAHRHLLQSELMSIVVVNRL